MEYKIQAVTSGQVSKVKAMSKLMASGTWRGSLGWRDRRDCRRWQGGEADERLALVENGQQELVVEVAALRRKELPGLGVKLLFRAAFPEPVTDQTKLWTQVPLIKIHRTLEVGWHTEQ